MGIVGVPGRGQFVCHGSVVMAGWRCPEADASSRWLIVIRTDLFLPTPSMIAVLCAARAIRWRNWRSWPGRAIRSAPRPRRPFRCSRGPMSARNTPPRRQKRARPLGRRHGAARQAGSPATAEYEEPEPEYQPSPVHPLHRYAAPPAAASEQDHHEPQQDADEQHGLIKSVEQENARDPAYPDDPYAYQRGYEEEPEPRTRSGRS